MAGNGFVGEDANFQYRRKPENGRFEADAACAPIKFYMLGRRLGGFNIVLLNEDKRPKHLINVNLLLDYQ